MSVARLARGACIHSVPRSAARRFAFAVLSGVFTALGAGIAHAQQYVPPLAPEQVPGVAAAIDSFRSDPRGPYLRIRWFCRDGTVQPPQGGACSERGGGNQHAELKPSAIRLQGMGFRLGTILVSTTPAAVFDSANANDWLKQLVLEAYLIDVDDGWVLRNARFYRGARQAEDEEAAGTALLEYVLARPDWVRANFWLANRLVAVVPHVGASGDQLVHRIRNLSSEVAELDPAFMPTRIKIHSFPSRDDIDAVERFQAREGLTPRVRTKLAELLAALNEQYDTAGRADRVLALAAGANVPDLRSELESAQRLIIEGRPRDALGAIADVATRLRETILRSSDGRANLRRMDLALALQEQAMILAQRLLAGDPPRSRRQRLRELRAHLAMARASGFLSDREFAAVADAIHGLVETDELGALEYRAEMGYITRALDWSVATVRSGLFPVLDRFAAVEPRALGFMDATLRGSILLSLSAELSKLSEDADRQLGTTHEVLGREPGPGVRGLNPGVARGTFQVLEAGHEEGVDRGSIYLVPEPTPELPAICSRTSNCWPGTSRFRTRRSPRVSCRCSSPRSDRPFSTRCLRWVASSSRTRRS